MQGDFCRFVASDQVKPGDNREDGNTNEDISEDFLVHKQIISKSNEIVKLLYSAVTEDEKCIMSLSGSKASGKDYILEKLKLKLMLEKKL